MLTLPGEHHGAIALEGAPSPHRECREDGGVLTFVDSTRVGQRSSPMCTECGGYLDGPEADGVLREEWED